MEACELLGVELRLDRIEAELARELPHHMRAFATAYAQSARPPPAPAVLLRPATLATARAALAHPFLADRGLALARLVAPVAIESDPAVAAARAAPASWHGLATLAAARDAAATTRLGRRALDALHRLHGTPAHRAIDTVARPPDAPAAGSDGPTELRNATALDAPGPRGALPPPVAGWTDPDGVALDDRAVAALWQSLRAHHGVDGAVRFERSATARPRAFVVEPGRDVVLVIPARLITPAARFAVLHELGHAIAALALPPGIPRVVDEAAAAYIARLMEHEAATWYSALARPARARRLTLACALAAAERQIAGHRLPSIAQHEGDHAEPPADGHARTAPPERPVERPPWALWHDPGAQAAYVAAEQLADAISEAIGVEPHPGSLAAQLVAHRLVIDRATTI